MLTTSIFLSSLAVTDATKERNWRNPSDSKAITGILICACCCLLALLSIIILFTYSPCRQMYLPVFNQVISMVSITTCCGCLSTVAFLRRATTCSWVTTLTVASSPSRRYVYCSHTRSNIPRTFSCCVATMSVLASIVSTDFTTNVSGSCLGFFVHTFLPDVFLVFHHSEMNIWCVALDVKPVTKQYNLVPA